MYNEEGRQSVARLSDGGGTLLVFAQPHALTFYADDPEEHKKILTIFNPYNFAVKFRVLCTAPQKYILADSEGLIKPGWCIDLVIRHNAIFPANFDVTDKFRIIMSERNHRHTGKREILAVLLKEKPKENTASANAEQEQFQKLPIPPTTDAGRGQQYSIAAAKSARDNNNTNILIVILGVIFAVVLMLPLQEEGAESHWSYFQPTVNIKLVASFFLGMVAAVIIKS